MAETKPPPPLTVIGPRRHPLRDFYHAMLRLTWPRTLLVLAIGFLLFNAIFAVVYALSGGIAEMRPGSLVDGFFFSTQTMATIGYGVMHPETTLAHVIVVLESLLSMLYTALTTGFVFAKFSRTSSRIEYSRQAVITRMDGVPTLCFRIGNERSTRVCDVVVRVAASVREETREGQWLYRSYDLTLARERIPVLFRSWFVLHTIDAASPLHGLTMEQFDKRDGELLVSIVGIDEVTLQPVLAQHNYEAKDILVGKRFADILEPTPDGGLILHVDKFHELVDEPSANEAP